MVQRIDLVGRKLLLFSLLPPPRSLSCYKNSCDMGDWVAHPSNTAARRILVTYPLLAAVSGEGSLEPLGIRTNKPTESLLHLLSHLGSWKPKLGLQNPTEFILCQWSLLCGQPGISSLSHCWRIKDVSLYDPQAYGTHTFFTMGFRRFLSIRGARGLQAFDLQRHTSY
jgi:hypothetical protein